MTRSPKVIESMRGIMCSDQGYKIVNTFNIVGSHSIIESTEVDITQNFVSYHSVIQLALEKTCSFLYSGSLPNHVILEVLFQRIYYWGCSYMHICIGGLSQSIQSLLLAQGSVVTMQGWGLKQDWLGAGQCLQACIISLTLF